MLVLQPWPLLSLAAQQMWSPPNNSDEEMQFKDDSTLRATKYEGRRKRRKLWAESSSVKFSRLLGRPDAALLVF